MGNFTDDTDTGTADAGISEPNMYPDAEDA
jgi:hypothetical protein